MKKKKKSVFVCFTKSFHPRKCNPSLTNAPNFTYSVTFDVSKYSIEELKKNINNLNVDSKRPLPHCKIVRLL